MCHLGEENEGLKKSEKLFGLTTPSDAFRGNRSREVFYSQALSHSWIETSQCIKTPGAGSRITAHAETKGWYQLLEYEAKISKPHAGLIGITVYSIEDWKQGESAKLTEAHLMPHFACQALGFHFDAEPMMVTPVRLFGGSIGCSEAAN